MTCTDPQRMLEFLRGKASDRKLRLFACACCRLAWDRLPDERSRASALVGERYAEGGAGKDDLRAAAGAAQAAIRAAAEAIAGLAGYAAALRAAFAKVAAAERVRADGLAYLIREQHMGHDPPAEAAERESQAAL